jgi:hypothetical protein
VATGGVASGGSNSGGTTGGISTGGSTGGVGTGGSTGGVSTGGTTGGVTTGGSTGGVTTGGSTGGVTTGGATNTGGLGPTGGSSATGGNVATGGSAAGGAGGGTGGSAATGGGPTAGSAGAGGQQPGAALNGVSWTMKCTKPDTDPGAGDRCWLLPMGQSTCPSAGYTSFDQTLNFGGTPGTTYQVTIHFEGTHEAGDYTGGTAMPKEFLKGATHNSGGLHTWLSMEVSAPAATYNPNAGAAGGSVQVYNYRATIQIEGGATVRLKAYDKDCLMHRYCQNNDIANCKGYVLEGISPAASPIDGSFLRMTVESVKAM